MLLLGNLELGLEYAPRFDGNPFRHVAPLSFAVLLGLAATGAIMGGARKLGGPAVWLAIVACAAGPVLFYFSSRHRLPFAFLLAMPAGIGAAEILVAARRRALSGRHLAAAGLGAAMAAASFAVPAADLRRTEDGVALANVAAILCRAGDLAGAEAAARRALTADPSSSAAWFNLGAALHLSGRVETAEAAYREALRAEPLMPDAAANLAAVLAGDGRSAEAVSLLRRVVARYPSDSRCWEALVLSLISGGDLAGAREAAAEARRGGASINPAVLARAGATSP